MVGLGRLELPTSRLSSARSNQLSYKPETTHGSNRNRTARPHGLPPRLEPDASKRGGEKKKEKRRRPRPANEVLTRTSCDPKNFNKGGKIAEAICPLKKHP